MSAATLTSIVYTPKSVGEKSTDNYDRTPAQRVELIARHGIEGDRKAGGNPDRHLNIMSRETLDQLAAEGYKTAPGQMGEQLVVSGLNVNALKAGDVLKLGESALVKIIKPRTGCKKFHKVQGHDPAEAQNRLGMMATVLSTGSIGVGDAVRVLEFTEASA